MGSYHSNMIMTPHSFIFIFLKISLIWAIDESEEQVDCGSCKFPFSYNEVEYNSCTTEDAEFLWCPTEVDENAQILEWEMCKEPCKDGKNNVTCDLCKFPFSYNEVEYNSCTMEGEESLWCATEVDENTQMLDWSWCKEPCSDDEKNLVTCDLCKFPFSYNEVEYNSCTTEDEELLWCATEVDENAQMLDWEMCKEPCKDGKN